MDLLIAESMNLGGYPFGLSHEVTNFNDQVLSFLTHALNNFTFRPVRMIGFKTELVASMDWISINLGGSSGPLPDEKNIQKRNSCA